MKAVNARHTARPKNGSRARGLLPLVLLLSLLPSAAAKEPAANDEPNRRLQVNAFATARGGQEARTLEPGKPAERELAEGQAHEYHIEVAAGEYFHVVVEKRGVDVSLQLYGSGEQALSWAHTPSGPRWSEELWWVAADSGTFRLRVNGAERVEPDGRYEVRIEALRPATARDLTRHRARQLLLSGWGLELQEQKTAESLRQALGLYEESRSLFKSIGDGKSEGEVLNRLGVVGGFFLSDYQKGLEYFQQSLALRQAAGDLPGQAGSLLNLGLLYDYLDENQKAIDHYEQALPLYRSLGIRAKEGATLNNLSDLYTELGEPEKALAYLGQALALFRSMRYSGDGVAMTLYNIGTAYRRMGQPQRALDYYEQSLANARAQNLFRIITAAMYGIGSAHSNLGRHREAVEHFERALSSYRTTGDRGGQALALTAVGKAHLDAGEPEKALDFLGRALSLWRALGGRDGEAAALYQLARCSRNLGDLAAARAQVEASLEIVESLRTKLSGQELRASYMASVQDYYEFYIDLLMQLHGRRPSAGHDAEALRARERASARGMLELLAEAGADIRQGVDPVLLGRERALQLLLNSKAESQTRLLSGKHTKEQADAAAKGLEEVAHEYRQVRARISVESPRYAALTQPQPLSLKEIQAEVLDPDTLLLEFSLGEERSYLWAVTPTSLNSFELPKRAEVEAAARRVYELLTARNRRPDGETAEQRRARVARADAAYPEAAAGLSRMLLGRAAPLLGQKRLLVVCDGVLQFIPFAALPTPANRADARAGAGPPLIVGHEIISLPSASTLAVLRRETGGRAPASRTVAVLADPVFDEDDERVRASSAGREKGRSPVRGGEPAFPPEVVRAMEDVADSSRRLPRLYNTRSEAEVIQSLARRGESLQALDFAANRAVATSDSLGQYRILHFATHAFINSTHPELSGIVLSLVNEQGQPQDGFLRAHEIFNLKLHAELVVLSACRTGLGKTVRGEGLIGLTRGFMYAGAPRVVVSLWSLSDKPTAELMAQFYRKMLGPKRLTPSAALRATQVEMWEDKRWGQPYFWAAFVLQGEWKPSQKGRP